jgi:hypothetical protein
MASRSVRHARPERRMRNSDRTRIHMVYHFRESSGFSSHASRKRSAMV